MSSVKASIALLCLTTFSNLVSAWPGPKSYVNIKTRSEQIADEYDYIIVGGGTSGLTVGDRLTEDGKSTVLVLEHGFYGGPITLDPTRMYNITSVPQPHLNDRRFNVGIGNIVGGSSAVNGMVFLRGTREEYDAWAELGGPNSTWTWEGILPYFKKGITLAPPDPAQAKEFNITYSMDYWGTTSKIFGSFGKGAMGGVMKVLYSAMKKMPGMTVPIDSGAGETGLYWYPLSQDPNTYARSYARSGHWDGLNRTNYELLVGAKVNGLLFDGDNATGVTFLSRNETNSTIHSVRARKEVILAAGAVHTPQILILSGIGPSAFLKEADIPIKIDLPGVGHNFQDHSYIPSVGFQWGIVPTANVSNPGSGSGAAPNLATMIGMPVISPDNFEAIAQRYADQDPTQYLPSSYDETLKEGFKAQHAVNTKFLRSKHVTFLEIMVRGPGGSVQNLHPMSRGTILPDPKNPTSEMIVDYNAGANPTDIDVMVENIRFMRRFMTTGDLAQYEAKETMPGANVTTDEDLAEWARQVIIPSVYHPIGTCAKVPREHGGVVDEDLLVYGTKKLSIIDSSIHPLLVGATTSMTVYAVAEKAADIIKARNS
ncbi:GMC oxidoreductase [Patellaria atrata CBS 101060]|uniref:GMC oxidoreductase n=1 Tax=Patellaria atrata CBS 101060 TaxID=1346257 RepID=A0A9P4S3K5_9PEZI|nr:GMC oxidoreductase [Patellaria atrata CBS 101060]